MSEIAVDTTSDLRSASTSGLSNLQLAWTAGFGHPGDGGGGTWYWDATDSTSSDNVGTVLAPNPLVAGRWKRVAGGTYYNTPSTTLDVRWFGAIPDFVTDVSSAIALAYAALPTRGCLYMPAGTYVVNSGISLSGSVNVTIKGDGPAATWIMNTSASSTTLEFTGMAECGVQNLSLVVNGSRSTTAKTIYIHGVASPRLEELTVATGGRAIFISQAVSASIVDVQGTTGNGTFLTMDRSGGVIGDFNFETSSQDEPPFVILGQTTSLQISNGMINGVGSCSGTLSAMMASFYVNNASGAVNDCSIN